MNTKPVPVTIALIASAVSCIMSIIEHVSFKTFVVRFALTALVFYILGSIIRFCIEKAGYDDKKDAVAGSSDDDKKDDKASETEKQ